MAIELAPETKKQLIASIKRFFAECMDEEVGDLKANLLLDFVLQEVGPSIYNGAIADAQAYFQEKVGDLDGCRHEPELAYWRSKRAERRKD